MDSRWEEDVEVDDDDDVGIDTDDAVTDADDAAIDADNDALVYSRSSFRIRTYIAISWGVTWI